MTVLGTLMDLGAELTLAPMALAASLDGGEESGTMPMMQ